MDTNSPVTGINLNELAGQTNLWFDPSTVQGRHQLPPPLGLVQLGQELLTSLLTHPPPVHPGGGPSKAHLFGSRPQLESSSPPPQLSACYLLSDDFQTLKTFAAELHISHHALRWSRAGMPFFIIGLHSRDIAQRRGALILSRPHLGQLVRSWRLRNATTFARL